MPPDETADRANSASQSRSGKKRVPSAAGAARPGRGRRPNRRRRSPNRGGSAARQPAPKTEAQAEGRNGKGTDRRRRRRAQGAPRASRRGERRPAPDLAKQRKALAPHPDYVEPEATFIHEHVRYPSYRDAEAGSLQRPAWFTRWATDAET